MLHFTSVQLPANFRFNFRYRSRWTFSTYDTLPFCELSKFWENIRISCESIEFIGNCNVSVDLEACCNVWTYYNNQFLDSNFEIITWLIYYDPYYMGHMMNWSRVEFRKIRLIWIQTRSTMFQIEPRKYFIFNILISMISSTFWRSFEVILA